MFQPKILPTPTPGGKFINKGFLSRDHSDAHADGGTTQEYDVSDQFNFRLPVSHAPIKPYFRVNSTIAKKEYLATFTFVASGVEVRSASDTPTGLQWSNALELPFSYIPGLEVPANRLFEVLEMPEFTPPAGTRQIIVTIKPWSNAAKAKSSPFIESVLETELLDESTLIFPR